MGPKDIFTTHRAEDADPNVPWNFCGHVHEKWMGETIERKLNNSKPLCRGLGLLFGCV